MRDLGTKQNKLIINDGRSGSTITLLYRNPTTAEEVAYQNGLFRRRGSKLITNVADTRLEFALKILEGFNDGDFGIDGKPISSVQGSANYQEDWKTLLKESASDILAVFAVAVFENTRPVANPEGFDIVTQEEEDNLLPLGKS